MASERSPLLQRRLAQALAAMRITTGFFFLLWAVEKFVRPEVNARIWDYFYRISIPVDFSYVLGAVNVVMALALILGLKRRFTYAYWTLFHTLSVLASYRQLFRPYGLGHVGPYWWLSDRHDVREA
jgi:uncharacterized membrane protein YphA (DoxX/SURF4 family)